MVSHATGKFEVTLLPIGADDPSGSAAIGRMSIAKQFHGDLDGVSQGQMITAMTDVEGSAGYVAIDN